METLAYTLLSGQRTPKPQLCPKISESGVKCDFQDYMNTLEGFTRQDSKTRDKQKQKSRPVLSFTGPDSL